MGLKAVVKNVNSAVAQAKREGEERQKKQKDAKPPVPLDTAGSWEQVVVWVLDWAGTVKQPFATNSSMELPGVIQEAWDTVFSDSKTLPVDIKMHPIIHKTVCGMTIFEHS